MLLCVSFGLTNQVWNYFEFFSKTYFVLENFKGDWLKTNFGKTGFKTCVLEKHFISYSCIFISYIQCFEECFQKSGYFFLKDVFLDFRSIQTVFRSIEISFKILCELLSVSINRNWFSINRNSWIKFFKNSVLTCSNIFFKTFFSLSNSGKAPQRFFCRFPPNFLQSFSLPKPVCLFYPSFCIVFLNFMHFLMVFG